MNDISPDSGAVFDDGQLDPGTHGVDWAGRHGHAGQFGACGLDGDGPVDPAGVDLTGTGYGDHVGPGNYVGHLHPDGSVAAAHEVGGYGHPDGGFATAGMSGDPQPGTFTFTPPAAAAGADPGMGDPMQGPGYPPGPAADPLLGTFTFAADTPGHDPAAADAEPLRFAGTAISGGSAVETKPADELIIDSSGVGHSSPSTFVDGTDSWEPMQT